MNTKYAPHNRIAKYFHKPEAYVPPKLFPEQEDHHQERTIAAVFFGVCLGLSILGAIQVWRWVW